MVRKNALKILNATINYNHMLLTNIIESKSNFR